MCSEEGGYPLNIKSLLNDVSVTMDVLRKGCSVLHEAKKCSDLPLVMLKIIHAPFYSSIGDSIIGPARLGMILLHSKLLV